MTDSTDCPLEATTPPDLPPATPELRSTRQRPGSLRGDVKLTLHTELAGNLLLGRRQSDDQHRLLSINNFGRDVDQMLQAAKDGGDAYATQALVTIDEQLSATERLLNYELEALQTKLTSNTRFAVEPSESTSPVVYPIRLVSPYAHTAVRLIAIYDEIVTTARTAQFVGLIDRRELKKVLEVTRKTIRSIFYSANRFKVSGVSFADAQQNTARAIEAVGNRGEIAPDILSGHRRPRHVH